jgi:hypothetical protein
VFDYILQEIISILRTTLRGCGYAPQNMMMIERIFGIDFPKDYKITDLKRQFPTRPILIRDVPSSSATPPSTHSGTATRAIMALMCVSLVELLRQAVMGHFLAI